MTDFGSRWQKWVVCLLLGAAVLALYRPVLNYGFIAYDDQDYVEHNQDIQEGFSWHNIRCALTTERCANWHPVTWMSHMLDCQLYGLKPGGHHLTNVVLHAANAVLLFLLLNRITSSLWPSAFVAAMFAFHPLRVESVVWISERKDVLSTFFWMLSVGAYIRYVKIINYQLSIINFSYVLSILFFALGLMSKPMLVTMPFVLLLLDYWPLGRLQAGAKFNWRVIVEKIPFFVLAAGDAVVTFLVQHDMGAVKTLTKYPISVRLANVPFAYMRYISKNFWPSELCFIYPHRPLSLLEVGGSACLIGVVSALVAWRWRAQPYLVVGWLWFLGLLVPTIGLVQVGLQAMADRYSYLPSVGLWIMVAWGVRDWVVGHPSARGMVALCGTAAVLACAAWTPSQIGYWRSTDELFKRTSTLADKPYRICYDLGCKAIERGDYPGAIRQFQQGLSTEVEMPVLIDHSRAYNNLGYAYLHEGKIAEAVTNFQIAIFIKPHYAEAHFNLGRAFLLNHQPKAAVKSFRSALVEDPGVAETHCQLANTLVLLDRHAEAIDEYSQALRLTPTMDEAANNLAWLLATCPDRSLRNGARAVELARQASQRSHEQNPVILGTLAAAYAEAGHLPDAVATAQKAYQLALAQNNRAYAAVLESQSRQYQDGGGGSRP